MVSLNLKNTKMNTEFLGFVLIRKEYTRLSKGGNQPSQTLSKLWLCGINASQHLLIKMVSEGRWCQLGDDQHVAPTGLSLRCLN